ncbi:hypothetical protein Tco_0319409 [Tanacetum coccineum]
MYYPRFTKVIIHYFLTHDKTISWRNKIGMHTSRDDYLINTPRFISAKEANQIYGVVLPESLNSPEIKETKAYKTYLGFAIGATPLKEARKFKKPASPQLTIVPVSLEEPTGKSKRVKRPTYKSTKAPAKGVVIRETLKMPLSKKKKKMTLEKRKGIDLLSEVALTKEAQYEEARQKSLRDFHKTHPSGSGTITKTAPSAAKIKPSGKDKDDSNNEQDSSGEESDQENDGDDDKTQSDNENESDSEHETDENKSGSESDQEENEEDIGDDEEQVKDEFIKTPSNDSDDEDEAKITDKSEGFIQEEGTNAEITNKIEVPVTNFSHSSDLASRFLNFSNIPHIDAEINSPMDVHVHHEQSTSTLPLTTEATNPQYALPNFASVFQFNNIVIALEKEVSKLKRDPLHTQVTALVDDHLDARLGATRDEFMNYLSASITARITEQVKIQLPQILPKEVSNFAPPKIQHMVTESLEQAILAKESSQPQSLYESAATLTEFELKKILIDKIDKSESYLEAPEHRECYEGLIKSYDLDKTLFSIYDKVYSLKRGRKDKDKDEDPSTKSDQGLKKRKTSKDT